MTTTIFTIAAYIFLSFCFAIGYGDNHLRKTKLPFWRAMLMGLMWPAWTMMVLGEKVTESEIEAGEIDDDGAEDTREGHCEVCDEPLGDSQYAIHDNCADILRAAMKEPTTRIL